MQDGKYSVVYSHFLGYDRGPDGGWSLIIMKRRFSSSSTAASVVYGGSASGPAMWKDENGVSLGELNK